MVEAVKVDGYSPQNKLKRLQPGLKFTESKALPNQKAMNNLIAKVM